MIKTIDFSNLPKIHISKNGEDTEIIDWNNSPGCTVSFNYDGIAGSFSIKEYSKGIITIESQEYGIKSFNVGNLKKCALGEYVGRFTKDFKVGIGDKFNDNNRSLRILDRKVETTIQNRYDKNRGKKRVVKKNEKMYLYHCDVDGYEGWITESNLLKGVGCAFCGNNAVIVGKNDLSTTHPDLAKYLIDPNDAKKYSSKSHHQVQLKCEYCGAEVRRSIAELTRRGFICPICSDGFSYPEKIIYSVLMQTKENFIYQLSSTTFDWVGKYRYDFYLKDKNTIIEVHGDQHYRTDIKSFWQRDNKKIDILKKELALKNGISHYIEIDARKSELEYIKANIDKTELPKIVSLSNIDWLQCEKYSRGNKVYDVCVLKANDKELTTRDISKITGIEQSVVRDYLRRGSKIGWCTYDPREEMRKSAANNHPRKPIIVLDESGKDVGHFPSTMALERVSIQKFGFKMHFSEVAARINPKSKKYGLPYHGYRIIDDK